MDIIDTHLHLIYRDKLGYGWTNSIPPLATGDFTLDDYAALTAGQGITGALFMEAGVDDADYQAEAHMVAGLIGQHGLLGQIASCRPETDAGFVAWLEECDDLHVHGHRRILHVVDDNLSTTATFRANLKKIGARGRTFDMCFLARQLPIALDLSRACDDQILVLDHCGVPDIAAGAFDDWAKSITALAALPHVYAKISGISAYCTPGTVSTATLAPWVVHVIASFGADRCVWGSDWPVVNLGTGLPDWLTISRDLLGGLTESEQSAIAATTARRIYRLK